MNKNEPNQFYQIPRTMCLSQQSEVLIGRRTQRQIAASLKSFGSSFAAWVPARFGNAEISRFCFKPFLAGEPSFS
jgi:hypothetical protein